MRDVVPPVAPPRVAESVIVAQIGARRRYAVPRMFYQKGILGRLYTDFAIPEAIAPTHFKSLWRGPLSRRTVRGIPPDKIRANFPFNLRCMARRSLPASELYIWMDDAFGDVMSRWGVGDAGIVYGMYGSGTPFWQKARARGLKVYGDLFITPMWHRIVREEQQRFADWETPAGGADREVEAYDLLTSRTIAASDVLICPSKSVQSGLKQFVEQSGRPELSRSTSIVVPYGIAVSPTEFETRPTPRRVIFAGSAELRKGIQYLASAERLLNRNANRFEIRIAGPVTDRIRTHPDCRGLVFLGQLTREALDAEFARADVLALPTLAEGSAAVVHEALAIGLPVITTAGAGSVVTDGQEGLLVPERDAEALAAAIERVTSDRALRDAMSNAAIKTAAGFDEGPWAERLVSAMGLAHA